ncbi:Cytochrome [Streptomyces formicae]|uniref:Cytochrome n=1 Tax=Streptomyces formicae TaxID=1616117 RepID=A0A291QLK8_9ACTN|nr:Cytochrome [Streptomyces formicae]
MSVEGVSKVGYKLSSPYGVGAVELRADAPDGKLLATTPVPNTGGWDTYQDTPDVDAVRFTTS